jgi:hypothetical protein
VFCCIPQLVSIGFFTPAPVALPIPCAPGLVGSVFCLQTVCITGGCLDISDELSATIMPAGPCC